MLSSVCTITGRRDCVGCVLVVCWLRVGCVVALLVKVGRSIHNGGALAGFHLCKSMELTNSVAPTRCESARASGVDPLSSASPSCGGTLNASGQSVGQDLSACTVRHPAGGPRLKISVSSGPSSSHKPMPPPLGASGGGLSLPAYYASPKHPSLLVNARPD